MRSQKVSDCHRLPTSIMAEQLPYHWAPFILQLHFVTAPCCLEKSGTLSVQAADEADEHWEHAGSNKCGNVSLICITVTELHYLHKHSFHFHCTSSETRGIKALQPFRRRHVRAQAAQGGRKAPFICSLQIKDAMCDD